MAYLGLKKGDTVEYEGLVLTVKRGQVELEADFRDGSKAWSDELLAGEYLISKIDRRPD